MLFFLCFLQKNKQAQKTHNFLEFVDPEISFHKLKCKKRFLWLALCRSLNWSLFGLYYVLTGLYFSLP